MSGVASALVSAATLLLVVALPSSSAARGAVACHDQQCGVHLPTELDGRAIPMNAQLRYTGPLCTGFAWSVEYTDGTLPDAGSKSLVLNDGWHRLPYVFEVGREVVVRSEPRCWERTWVAPECASELENDCCHFEGQPLQDAARFLVVEADEVPPEAPEIQLLCRDDGLIEIQVLSVAADAYGVQFGVRGLDDDPAGVWSESARPVYSLVEGFCNAPGDVVQVPGRLMGADAEGWEPWSGQLWFGARAIDLAGNVGAVKEVLLDTANCERVESNEQRIWPIACERAAWPLAPELTASSPLASEFASPFEERISQPVELCFPELLEFETELELEDPWIVPEPDPVGPKLVDAEDPSEPAPSTAPAVSDDVSSVHPVGTSSGGCACRARGADGAGAWALGLALLVFLRAACRRGRAA